MNRSRFILSIVVGIIILSFFVTSFADDVYYWSLKVANYLYVRDTGLYLTSPTDGQLDIVGDTNIEITSPSIELEGQTNYREDITADAEGADVLTVAESGGIFYNDASNGARAFTLPLCATATIGVNYTFVCGAGENDAITIVTGDTTDTTGDMFLGGVLYCAAAAVNTLAQSAADNNTITLDDNLANSGAGPGTWVKVTCINATTWFVQGIVEADSDADGTGTAIFSDAD